MNKISPKYFYRPLSAGRDGDSQATSGSSSTLPRLSVCSSSSSVPNCSASPTNRVTTSLIRSTSSTTSSLAARARPDFHSFGLPAHQHHNPQQFDPCPHCIIPPTASGTFMSVNSAQQPTTNLVLLKTMPSNLYGGGSPSYMTYTTTVGDGGGFYAPHSSHAHHSEAGYGGTGTEASTYYEQLDDRWQQQQNPNNKTYNTLLPRPMPVRHTNGVQNRRMANRRAFFTLAVVGSLLVFWLLYLLLCSAFDWPLFSVSPLGLTSSLLTTTSRPTSHTVTNVTVAIGDDGLARTAELNAQPPDPKLWQITIDNPPTQPKTTTPLPAKFKTSTSTFESSSSSPVSITSAVPVKLERRLPQAIIIGVKKGGTRALLAYLRMNSKVRTAGPEPHFFDRHYDRGAEWYRNQMPLSTPDEITIEKTPSYFVTERAAERVYKLNPHTKIFIVLRDPVERAESDYAQSYAKNRTTRSFEQMALRLPPPFNNHHSEKSSATFQRAYRKARVNTDWNAIKLGVYVHYLRAWLKWFPRQQIHIVSGEGLIYQPAQEIEAVQTFLGLPVEVTEKNFFFNATKGFPCVIRPVKPDHGDNEYESLAEEELMNEPHCLGSTKGREHPHVNPLVLQKLRNFYAPYNDELTKLTGFQHNWQ